MTVGRGTGTGRGGTLVRGRAGIAAHTPRSRTAAVVWLRWKAIVALLVLCIGARISPLAAQSTVQWHGYAQIRGDQDDPGTGFSVRRAKLWATGSVPGLEGVAFKVQGIFRNVASGTFVLQDVFAQVRRHAASVRLGQFVPDFSLQRSQPDYRVPLVERAAVVTTLVPAARTMARDIGVQGAFDASSGTVHASVGVFNGAGANHAGSGESALATARTTVTAALGTSLRATVGGSLAWRRTTGTDVGTLSSEGVSFSGHDRRWGLEGRLTGASWSVQAEYLHADLSGETSYGYYVLGETTLTARDQVALSVQELDTPVRSGDGGFWYVAGYTRFLVGAPSGGAPAAHPLPTKIMADVRVRPDPGRARVGLAVQLQMFVH